MPQIPDDDVNPEAFLDKREILQMTGHLHSNRRVLLSGELNEKSLRRAAVALIKLDFGSNEPITLILDSGGGNVFPSRQFADTINMLNSPVDVIVAGDCRSMAVDIVQICRRRMLLPSARMLVHYNRNNQPWIADDLDLLERDIAYFMQQMREIREARFALYERRTGHTRERLEEMFRHGEVHSAYFSAEQAVEFHLADEIVTDFKLFSKRSEEKSPAS